MSEEEEPWLVPKAGTEVSIVKGRYHRLARSGRSDEKVLVPPFSSLSIEAWFAPSLQYLPVRIVIRRGADEFIDLMIERLPLQAADEPLGGSALR